MIFTESPYEFEMMQIPHMDNTFTDKQKFRSEIKYSRSCKSCPFHKTGPDKCERTICCFIDKRIETRNITLLELIPSIVYSATNKEFITRTINLYKKINGGYVYNMFRGKSHKKAFENIINKYEKQRYKLSNRFTAALFLITADNFLWKQTKRFVRPNLIDLSKANIRGIDSDGYLLYKAAKDMMFKTSKVTASELADKSFASEKCFKVIITAIIIARYGRKTIELGLIPKKEKEIISINN